MAKLALICSKLSRSMAKLNSRYGHGVSNHTKFTTYDCTNFPYDILFILAPSHKFLNFHNIENRIFSHKSDSIITIVHSSVWNQTECVYVTTQHMSIMGSWIQSRIVQWYDTEHFNHCAMMCGSKRLGTQRDSGCEWSPPLLPSPWAN